MVAIMEFFLYFNLFLCNSLLVASTCSPPIVLPITNVLLSNQQTTRGILAQVGNPPQNISFMPDARLNDTWIYNTTATFCSNTTTTAQCVSQRGGLYNPAASNTSKTNLDVYKAGGNPSDVTPMFWGANPGAITGSSWATDNFGLSNVTLPGFPIGMPGLDMYGPYNPQAILGLGQNSSLLDTLKAAGLIQARTYSFWFGKESATPSRSVDGQFVLGGYDAAKVIGPGFTQPLSPPSVNCPSGMPLNFIQLGLNFPNASTANLIDTNSIAACIQLNFPIVVNVPYTPYYERFLNDTGTFPWGHSYGTHFYVDTYPTNNVYNGALNINLQGGLSTQIPNDALVIPDQQVGPSGAIIYNSTSSALLLGSLQDINKNDEPQVGKVFFTSTYLMVDLDAMTYTLWPVNSTTASRLVASGNCSSSSSPSNSTVTPETDHSGHGSNAGAIAGGVVGGLAGLAIIVIAGLFFWRRKRRTAPQETPVENPPAAPEAEVKKWPQYHDEQQMMNYPVYHEAPAERPKPQELDGALPTHELDVVRPTHELEGSEVEHGRL